MVIMHITYTFGFDDCMWVPRFEYSVYEKLFWDFESENENEVG